MGAFLITDTGDNMTEMRTTDILLDLGVFGDQTIGVLYNYTKGGFYDQIEILHLFSGGSTLPETLWRTDAIEDTIIDILSSTNE